MKKSCIRMTNYSFIIALFLTLWSCQNSENIFNETTDLTSSSSLKSVSIARDVYIIQLDESIDSNQELKNMKGYEKRKTKMNGFINGLLHKYGFNNSGVQHTYTNSIYGFSAELTPLQAEKLAKDPMVLSIELDQIVALVKPGITPASTEQNIPWGITRIGGASDGTGKRAWIIDSGIDLDHPDLNVNTTLSKSFIIRGKTTPDDEHGHGTHVAGTVAAIDNNLGVIGVAAGAEVVALRVLDRRGSGYTSWIIAAIDYVAANGQAGDAVNMSLGPEVRSTDDVFDNTVISVAEQGFLFAIAAGNSSDDALYYSPARANHTNIYTVSAMDINDNFASFSNYGSPVDFCAPGVNVTSCYLDGGYATMNGTSMASPHVCGLLLLGPINTDGTVNNDPDSTPDPIAHR